MRRLAFAFVVLAAFARPALAQDAPPPPEATPPPAKADGTEATKPADSEFETSWFGIRPEIWYQPTIGMQAKVGGSQTLTGTTLVLDNTTVDASKDLGVLTHSAKPTYLDFGGGPLGGEMFIDTRWVSLSLWGVTPFEYHGSSVVTRSFSFGGFTFTAQRPVETDLKQWLAGLDIKINLINNRWVRVSPVIAARALAIDWTVKDVGQPPIPGASISTEDIDFPLAVGSYKLFPYPEVGAEVRAGYRDIVEVDAKLTGMYVNYLGVQATTALFDGGVTGYIPFLPYVGARVGFRYFYMHARTSNQNADRQFDGQLRLYGLTFSLIARF